MEKVTLTLPDGLKQKAHDHGINVSKTCANAISEIVQKIEYGAARDSPSKDKPVTATAETQRGGTA